MDNQKSEERLDSLEQLLPLLEALAERKRSKGRTFKQLLLLITGGLGLTALLVGAGLWQTGTGFLTVIRSAIMAPPPPPKVDIQSLVLEQVRTVSELTTAVFAMQAVVPTSRDRTLGSYVIGRTTLLYIAYGEVRAGVDLGGLTSGNVQVNGDSVAVTLPPPQILDSKIDVNRSKVYDYDRGFLALGPDVAPDLQHLAQQKTLQTILEAACQQGILQQASDRAKVVVTQLLNTAGYQQFSVTVQPSAEDACISSP